MQPTAHPPLSDGAAAVIAVALLAVIALIPILILRRMAAANARTADLVTAWATALRLPPAAHSAVPAATAAHHGPGRSFAWRDGVLSVLPVQAREPMTMFWAALPSLPSAPPIFGVPAGLDAAWLSTMYTRRGTGDAAFDAAFATYAPPDVDVARLFGPALRAAIARGPTVTQVSFSERTLGVSIRGAEPADWDRVLALLALAADGLQGRGGLGAALDSAAILRSPSSTVITGA